MIAVRQVPSTCQLARHFLLINQYGIGNTTKKRLQTDRKNTFLGEPEVTLCTESRAGRKASAIKKRKTDIIHTEIYSIYFCPILKIEGTSSKCHNNLERQAAEMEALLKAVVLQPHLFQTHLKSLLNHSQSFWFSRSWWAWKSAFLTNSQPTLLLVVRS